MSKEAWLGQKAPADHGPERVEVMLGNLWRRVRRIFSPALREEEIREQLDRIRKETPTPVFWMVGKTQSGKTSLIRYLTGAERAEIGKGFQPCTRFSSKYVF